VKFSLNLNIRFKFSATLLIVLFLHSGTFSQSNNEQPDTISGSKVIVEDPYVVDTAKASDEEDQAEYFDLKNLANPSGSFSKQQLPDSVLKAMQQNKDFWYANYVFEKEKDKAKGKDARVNQITPLRDQTWFKTLMWLIIIGGFVYALVSYIGSTNSGLFRRAVKSINDEDQFDETENIFEINYKERIDRAVRAGNFQLAVRLHFLQMLKTLSGRNVIQYKQDRTNFDYMMQLRSTSYYNDFFRLTRNYEYAWFGNFEVNEEMYHIIKNEFEKFDSGLLGK
jgi:hypothetical protein